MADAYIPYGRQSLDEDDRRAVMEVLESDWLTTGPKVGEFEAAVARYCGAAHGVAVSSGTAALHCLMAALDLGPGDEVVVPAMTFAATANAVAYTGATPVFADVDPRTLLLDPGDAARRMTDRTRAVVGVDYAGQPCDWTALADLARGAGVRLLADACHALGAEEHGRRAGTLAQATVFSFHPVKHITTGEGGMLVCDDEALAHRVRRLRNHGMDSDARSREENGAWRYEQQELGFNYRLTDIQSALGLSQLAKLEGFLARRSALAGRYAEVLAGMDAVRPLGLRPDVRHAWHLYVVKLDPALDRDKVFAAMRARNIGVNVHYMPVHLHPYYRRTLGTGEGLCPVAEDAFGRMLSLPLYPDMTEAHVDRVAACLAESMAESMAGAGS